MEETEEYEFDWESFLNTIIILIVGILLGHLATIFLIKFGAFG